MEFLSQIPLVGGFASYAIPFLFVLTIVVFVHEYGHYIVGRWCGIQAEEFSIGFGPEVWGRIDRRGTRWKICALPLGGYVKFLGDANTASGPDPESVADMAPEKRERTFHGAKLWKRASVVLAGPVANFLLSIAVFAGLAVTVGRLSDKPVIGAVEPDSGIVRIGFAPGDEIVSIDGAAVTDFFGAARAIIDAEGRNATAVVRRGGAEMQFSFALNRPAIIDTVEPDSAADEAGLRAGDEITEVDGSPLPSFHHLQEVVAKSGGAKMTLTILREGRTVEVVVAPKMVKRAHPAAGESAVMPLLGVTKSYDLGLAPLTERLRPFSAVAFGVKRTWAIISQSLEYLADMVVGSRDASELSGPIRIAEVSGKAAEQGAGSLIAMIALISASIGLINLFPIPVLDGGHLLFYAIEWVRGRPLSDRWLQYGMNVGLSVVLLLMVFATYNDLSRF